jgi:mRNA-capping enzyme
MLGRDARQERFALLEKEVFEPRRADRADTDRARAAGGAAGLRYDYAGELFSARRKDFWPLFRCRSLLEKFIPTLCHETDGLILQVGTGARMRLPPAGRCRSSTPRLHACLLLTCRPRQGYEDAYKPGTCEELLKWKFAHLNSVDFLLRSTAAGAPPARPGAAARALDTTRHADVGRWCQGRSCTCWRRGGTGRAA